MRLVFLDLTHVGRHVTGIERIAIEQFEKTSIKDVEVRSVKAGGVVAMILKQQLLLPLLALLYPRATFVFPGFPPSPIFVLYASRVVLYVHDTFLLTRRVDLSAKARLYMAPQFGFALRHLKRFLANSEKTARELRSYISSDAEVQLYRPAIENHFGLESRGREARPARPAPLRLVTLGTIEPRKNYNAAIAILEALRKRLDPGAELHIIGRFGWAEDTRALAAHPGVTLHGYLEPDAAKRVLEAADVYLCTSHDEGLGLPLLEAQFASLPVVAPDQPVFREVLAGSGAFIDPKEPTEAADVIARLIDRPDWRAEAASSALANVQRWNGAAAADLAIVRATLTELRMSFSTKAAPARGRAQ